MRQKKLVSIITPCYNNDRYIHRLLESVLQQTYPNIEMYVIDDGSTDNSADVIKSYIPGFQAKGYKLEYRYQENQGQSAAINNALKLIRGDYLVWPDSDDYYASPYAIEKMVNALDSSSSEFAMVRTLENLLEDGSFVVKKVFGENAPEESDYSLFEDCLLRKNGYYYCSGAYMIDVNVLTEELNGREIWTSKPAGQNWQLMLPVLLRHRCITIKEPLYNVVCRLSSHSRGGMAGYEKTMDGIAIYEQTELETIDRLNISISKKAEYKHKVQRMYGIQRLKYSLASGDKDRFVSVSKKLIETHCLKGLEILFCRIASVSCIFDMLYHLRGLIRR